MKIVVIGPIFINICMYVEGEFDNLGNNSGHATVSYSSIYSEIAEVLAADPANQVIMLTSLDTEASPYIIRKLKSSNICTKYILDQPCSTGFNITFNCTDMKRAIHSNYNVSKCVDQLKLFNKELLSDTDLVITCPGIDIKELLFNYPGVSLYTVSEHDTVGTVLGEVQK